MAAMAYEGHGQQPDILARLSLPIHPSGATTSSNNAGSYRHVLLSRAINPSMDLVLVLSRDVSQASSSSTSAISGGLPPQPAGMSQNMSEARRRMIMLSRQKMLGAKGGALATSSMATSAAAATPPAPRLTKCPPIRISLWRMPSDGESGVLVWDSQVEVPDIWGTEGHDLAELEDMSVTASCWTKKGREATLVVQVSRKDVKGARPLKAARYLCIYNVQTGAQERAIPIDESPASVVGLTWVPTDELGAPCTGSARHVLNLLNPLPRHADLPRELKQGPGPPTPLRRKALANKTIKKALEESRNLAESVPTTSLGLAVQKFPRLGSQAHQHGLVAPPPAASAGAPFRRRGTVDHSNTGLLCAWDEDEVFLFFDGTVCLGNLPAGKAGRIATSDLSDDGCMRIASRVQREEQSDSIEGTQEGLSFSTVRPFAERLRPLERWKELAALSTGFYYLLEHAYDNVVLLRIAHCQLRASSLERWTNSVRSVAKAHATDVSSSIIRTLLTGVSNEAMFNLLTGSVSGDDGDMHRLTASAVREIDTEQSTAFRFMARQARLVAEACQRCLVLSRDLKGLLLWPSQSPLKGAEAKQEFEELTASLSRIVMGARSLADEIDEEARSWRELHKWWKYERARQEAIKAGVDEASVSVQYEVLSISNLVERGFLNLQWERSLGLELDEALVRVDDEDEDLDEEKVPVSRPQPQTKVKDQDDNMAWTQPETKELSSFEIKLQAAMEHLDQPVGQPQASRKERQPVKRDGIFISSSLPQELAQVFTKVSKLLSRGFREVVSSDATVDHIGDLPIPDTHILCSLRKDELFSSCVEQQSSLTTPAQASVSSHSTSLLPQVRSQISKDGSKSRIAFVTRVPSSKDTSLILNLVEVPRSPSGSIQSRQIPANSLLATTEGRVGALDDVIDLQWYNDDELFLLCRGPVDGSSTTTMLLSIRPSKAFSQHQTETRTMAESALLHRRYVLSDPMASRAMQVAFNSEKDVAATLDERGQLLYWDLVS